MLNVLDIKFYSKNKKGAYCKQTERLGFLPGPFYREEADTLNLME